MLLLTYTTTAIKRDEDIVLKVIYSEVLTLLVIIQPIKLMIVYISITHH